LLYAVLLVDNPDFAHMRPRHMAAHLDFLDRNSAKIRSAGPLKEADGAGAGGLWLVEADSPGAVQALVEADPFWPTGLRQSVRVLQWTLVVADGKRKA
jgi:uncharacterized protein YciI